MKTEKYRTYQFYDKETGEDFFVEETTKQKAVVKAKKYFQKPVFIEEVSYFYADILGYDTY